MNRMTDEATVAEDPYKSINITLVIVWVFGPGVMLTQGQFPGVLRGVGLSFLEILLQMVKLRLYGLFMTIHS